MDALLRALDGGDPSDLGGKAGRLQQLLALGVPVPPGFVLPAARFREALAALPPGSDPALIAEAPLAPPLRAALADALARLPPGPVAVRSSGLDEDGESSSFAGQHHTSLNVEGADAVEDAVRRCWASALTSSVGAYREASGAAAPPAMAVLVQPMVPAEAAGVLFTRDPTDGAQRVVVEAVRGLGEALVSGRATPDRALYDRQTGQIQGGGDTLPQDRVQALVQVGLDLEARLGEPVDLEWAWAEGRLWVLQARPITALPEPAPRYVWAANNAGELFPRVATPATLWGVKLAIEGLLGPVFRALGVDLGQAPMVGLVAGRIYLCMNTFVALVRAVPGFKDRSPAELFGGDMAELAAAMASVPDEAPPGVRVRAGRLLWGSLGLGFAALRQQAVNTEAVLGPTMALEEALWAEDFHSLNDADLISFIIKCFNLNPLWLPMVQATGVGIAAFNAVLRLSPRWTGEPGDTFFSGMGGVGSAGMALDLWAVVEAGRPLPALREDVPLAKLQPELEQSAQGRAFLAALEGWMRAHGHRARGEADVAIPRYRETPDAVLAMVRALLEAPEGASPQAQHSRAAAQRKAREEGLIGKAGPVRGRILLGLVRRAQRGLTLRENAKGLLIQRVALARRALLLLGERWVAAGRLVSAEDALFLNLDELREAAGDPALPLKGLVRRRRREQRTNEALNPPPVVVGRFDPTQQPAPPATGAVLRGIGVSPGLVEGRARVLLASDEGSTVLPGEILVAPFTDPGWAPHFVAAAGLVVDSGGVLSHGSIVARELGLPAVVNATGATRRVRTGDRLLLDGFRGEVHLLDAPTG